MSRKRRVSSGTFKAGALRRERPETFNSDQGSQFTATGSPSGCDGAYKTLGRRKTRFRATSDSTVASGFIRRWATVPRPTLLRRRVDGLQASDGRRKPTSGHTQHGQHLLVLRINRS